MEIRSLANGKEVDFDSPPNSPTITKKSHCIQQVHPNFNKKPMECALCKKNDEMPSVYRSHSLRDSTNNLICPILYNYTCPICGDTKEKAHTAHYCSKLRSGAVSYKPLEKTGGGRKDNIARPLMFESQLPIQVKDTSDISNGYIRHRLRKTIAPLAFRQALMKFSNYESERFHK